MPYDGRPDSHEGICDCHIHVYDNAYALAPGATFTLPHAPAADYRDLQQALGTTRTIVVQPTGYGFDNRCMLAAMHQLGAGARGIAVLPSDVTDAELGCFHEAGVRGVRFMMPAGGLLPWSALEAMAARIAPLGWINLQLDGCELPARKSMLARLPARVVIGHIGKSLGPVRSTAAVASLLRLLDAGHCWAKLSAPTRARAAARRTMQTLRCWRARSRCTVPTAACGRATGRTPMSCRNPRREAVRMGAELHRHRRRLEKILVDNPAELYGFL